MQRGKNGVAFQIGVFRDSDAVATHVTTYLPTYLLAYSRDDSRISHGEPVEDVELGGEGVELKLNVRSVGERQCRYATAGIDVQTVDELTTDVEKTQEVVNTDAR